ncbi:hypothetical protein [Roseiflexus sp.]|uniref:hypothetical protein n=1 Tax=Roseiflexus sp. TaxID=2562120 RepID=UPI00398B4670
MSDNDNTERYMCSKCGYLNIWTRDEILQRGREIVYRGDNEDVYSLRCKNPKGCDQRMRIAVKRREK